LFADLGRDTAGPAEPPPLASEDGWRSAVDRLLEFWNWSEDWDGEGAAAPDRGAIRGAITLVRELAEGANAMPQASGPQFLHRPPDRLLPGRDGEILIEWHFPEYGYAELEVASATQANGMLVFSDGRPSRFETVSIRTDADTIEGDTR